ncbi:unnamed protein product [Chondrus crispus]|uniref:Uncharacterized protein n=1 Tax=Chondrus crispus TaxID=2769 RepID=R7Q5M0_CHOCR|nr:unnamed protein product [Chondrus crispus]CDF32671.1 unnamed protein product [Chondrus crispus]|eukprot:XP_005712442.1 unnamed protein product [Chondrus crispus]
MNNTCAYHEIKATSSSKNIEAVTINRLSRATQMAGSTLTSWTMRHVLALQGFPHLKEDCSEIGRQPQNILYTMLRIPKSDKNNRILHAISCIGGTDGGERLVYKKNAEMASNLFPSTTIPASTDSKAVTHQTE